MELFWYHPYYRDVICNGFDNGIQFTKGLAVPFYRLATPPANPVVVYANSAFNVSVIELAGSTFVMGPTKVGTV